MVSSQNKIKFIQWVNIINLGFKLRYWRVVES